MTNEEHALIKYRMDRAKETIDEAVLLFEAGHINTYVNRLYYACFYAASALLLLKNFSTSKHSHLRSLLHKEFVKPGIIPTKLGKHFDILFDNRQEGDYGDYTKFKVEEVKGWLEQTRKFINQIEEVISKEFG